MAHLKSFSVFFLAFCRDFLMFRDIVVCRVITQACPMMFVGLWSNPSGKEQPKHPISRDDAAKLLITDKYGNIELNFAFMHQFFGKKPAFKPFWGQITEFSRNYRIFSNYGKTTE